MKSKTSQAAMDHADWLAEVRPSIDAAIEASRGNLRRRKYKNVHDKGKLPPNHALARKAKAA